MVSKKSEVVLRPERRITLPGGVCEELGIEPGDSHFLRNEKLKVASRITVISPSAYIKLDSK